MAKFKDNLYDLLNVKEDCSAKEIKAAFIELSKKYHPDRSSNKDFHRIFVKVNEAYGILSKPSSRRMYDQHLHVDRDRPYVHYYEDIYTTRQKKTNFGNEPYYSIKGLKKVSNSVIVTMCLIFAVVGASAEFLAIRNSFTYDHEKGQHDTARNQLILEHVRKRAAEQGNETQLKNLKEGTLEGKPTNYFNELYVKRLRERHANLEQK